MKKSIALLTAALLAGSAIAQSAAHSTLRVGVAALSSGHDPARDLTNAAIQFHYNIFDTLILKDHTSENPVYEPGLATSWTWVEDNILELELREGVMFHDGTELGASDVKFSLERVQPEPPYATAYDRLFSNLDRVDVIDDSTVQIVYERPDPIAIDILTTSETSIIPEGYFTEVGGSDEFRLAPVGTGPYAVESFTPDDSMTLTAFAGHWGEPAPADRIEISLVPEVVTRITALVNNELDLITNVPSDQLSSIQNTAGVHSASFIAPVFHVIFYHTNHPTNTWLHDARVRRALNLAIDRELIAETVWNGDAAVPNGFQYASYGDLYDADRAGLTYDPEAARALLEEAGYDGSVIDLDVYEAYYTNGELTSQVLVQMWEEAGLNVQLHVGRPFNTYTDDNQIRYWSNPMYFPDPVGAMAPFWGPGGSRIPQFWTPGAEYDALWDTVRFSTDAAERSEAHAAVLDYFEEEAPATILFQPLEHYGVRDEITWQPLIGSRGYLMDFRSYNLSFNHD